MLRLEKIPFILSAVLVEANIVILLVVTIVDLEGTVVLVGDMATAEVAEVIAAPVAMDIVEEDMAIVAEGDMGIAEAGTIIVEGVEDTVTADLVVDTVDPVVIIVEGEVTDIVVVDMVVVTIVEEEAMVIVVGVIMVSVTIAIIIKIPDTSPLENQDHTDIHLQTLNADMKKRHCMLQRQNISSTRNASPCFLLVAGRNMLQEKELDLRKFAMNLV